MYVYLAINCSIPCKPNKNLISLITDPNKGQSYFKLLSSPVSV